jgi:hypothetical protein
MGTGVSKAGYCTGKKLHEAFGRNSPENTSVRKNAFLRRSSLEVMSQLVSRITSPIGVRQRLTVPVGLIKHRPHRGVDVLHHIVIAQLRILLCDQVEVIELRDR